MASSPSRAGGRPGRSPGPCQADLDDERFDAPEARGLGVLVRGLSMVADYHRVPELSGRLFDGLYEYLRRGPLLGREPA